MRVTRAIKEYIESRVNQATEAQINELAQKSKAWNEEHKRQVEKFESIMEDMFEKYALKTVLPKIKKIAPKETEVHMDNYYSHVPSEKKTKDEIFAFRFAQVISGRFGYTKDNPYEEKVDAFNKARDNKISEIILQLELGAKREELEQMLSNISIEV